ncbi:hypothetical protein [Microbaculum sp. FT89]|uniref:hypothetical protein n=1 Tax=Microbaculum sp. FT89 TaxID=3447298 RepID=UPI003F530B60
MLLFSDAAFAADSSDYRVVDGLAIYYAVLPAEVIRGHPKGHPEAVMHGGVPKGKHVHHVMVALFDGKTMERVTDAQVTATVAEPGLAGRKKQLEPFTVADALTYGNYFEFSKLATYTIDTEVRRPGSSRVVKTRFAYRHH